MADASGRCARRYLWRREDGEREERDSLENGSKVNSDVMCPGKRGVRVSRYPVVILAVWFSMARPVQRTRDFVQNWIFADDLAWKASKGIRRTVSRDAGTFAISELHGNGSKCKHWSGCLNFISTMRKLTHSSAMEAVTVGWLLVQVRHATVADFQRERF